MATSSCSHSPASIHMSHPYEPVPVSHHVALQFVQIALAFGVDDVRHIRIAHVSINERADCILVRLETEITAQGDSNYASAAKQFSPVPINVIARCLNKEKEKKEKKPYKVVLDVQRDQQHC